MTTSSFLSSPHTPASSLHHSPKAPQSQKRETEPLEEREIRILNLFQSVSNERLQEFTDFMPWFTHEKKYVFKGPKNEQEERVRKINALLTGFLGLTTEDPAYLHKAHRVFREECVSWVSETWKGKTLSEKFADMTSSFEAKHDELGRLKLNEIKAVYLTPKFNLEKLDEMQAFTENYYSNNNKKPSKHMEIDALAKPLIDSVMNYYYGGVEYKKHLGKQHLPQKICAAKLALLVNNNERFEEVFNGICNQHIKGWKELHIDEKTQKELLELFIYSIKERKGRTPSLASSQVQYALKLLTLFPKQTTQLLIERISLIHLIIDKLGYADHKKTEAKSVETIVASLYANASSSIPHAQKVLNDIQKQEDRAKKRQTNAVNSSMEITQDAATDCPYVRKIRLLASSSTTLASVLKLMEKAIHSRYISDLPKIFKGIPESNAAFHHFAVTLLTYHDLKRMQKDKHALDQRVLNDHIGKLKQILSEAETNLMTQLRQCIELIPSAKSKDKSILEQLWKKRKATLETTTNEETETQIEGRIIESVLPPYRQSIAFLLNSFGPDQALQKLETAGLLKVATKVRTSWRNAVDSFLSGGETVIDQTEKYKTLLQKALHAVPTDLANAPARYSNDLKSEKIRNSNDSLFDQVVEEIFEKTCSHQTQRIQFKESLKDSEDFPLLAVKEISLAFQKSQNNAWLIALVKCLAKINHFINVDHKKMDGYIHQIIDFILNSASLNYEDPVFQKTLILLITEIGLNKKVLKQLLESIPEVQGKDREQNEGQNPRHLFLETCLEIISSKDFRPIAHKDSEYYRESILHELTLFYVEDVRDILKMNLPLIHQVVDYFHSAKPGWEKKNREICEKIADAVERHKEEYFGDCINTSTSQNSSSNAENLQDAGRLPPDKIEALASMARMLYSSTAKGENNEIIMERGRCNGAILVKQCVDERLISLDTIHTLLSEYFSHPFSTKIFDVEGAFHLVLKFAGFLELSHHPDSDQLRKQCLDFFGNTANLLLNAKEFRKEDYRKILRPFWSHYTDYSKKFMEKMEAPMRKRAEKLVQNFLVQPLHIVPLADKLGLLRMFLESSLFIKELRKENVDITDREIVHNLIKCCYWLSRQIQWTDDAIPKGEFFELIIKPCEMILQEIKDTDFMFDKKIQKEFFAYIHYLLVECKGAMYLRYKSTPDGLISELKDRLNKLLDISSPEVTETQGIRSLLYCFVKNNISPADLKEKIEDIFTLADQANNDFLLRYILDCLNGRLLESCSQLTDWSIPNRINQKVFDSHFLPLRTRIIHFIRHSTNAIAFVRDKKMLIEPVKWDEIAVSICDALLGCAEKINHSNPEMIPFYFQEWEKTVENNIRQLEGKYALIFLLRTVDSLTKWTETEICSATNRLCIYEYAHAVCKKILELDASNPVAAKAIPLINASIESCKKDSL